MSFKSYVGKEQDTTSWTEPTKFYEWLKRNAPSHGFVRAVSKESWHWEYRPVEAAQLGPGKFMLPGIHD